MDLVGRQLEGTNGRSNIKHANVELTTLDAKAGPKMNRITSNKKTKGHPSVADEAKTIIFGQLTTALFD